MGADELARMASLLTRRGPDRTGIWRADAIGLGHTLLATTPELVFEQQPFRHAESGCAITADVRLDNRPELLASLGIDAERAQRVGDAEIILTAYLTWGEACVERLLGDFAFAIWDPREQSLLCARDHFGMRPLYYHHTPGRFFAFASEPRAILVLPQTPYRINEGRIADFLVSQLEGIDKTSTFFEEVYRLPPAHVLTVTPDGMKQRRYWTLEPGPELRLASNEAYAEAFLEVFTEAVRCRLRSAGPVGSMLSGGMDSGSVVAVARGLLAEEGRGPLPTFSAVGPDPETCVETRTIHAALTMEGLEPHLVNHAELKEWLPELEELTWNLDEPFDAHMTLVRTLYLVAHRRGIKVLLDGGAGDVVLGEGTYLARLLQRGRWRTAYREAVAQNLFWGRTCPPAQGLFHAARTAFVPHPVRRLLSPLRAHQRLRRTVRNSGICPRFARRIRLSQRLDTLAAHGSVGASVPYRVERAGAIEHPYLTVGRERYDRVASAVAIEPRDPFLDRRVVNLCLSLPGEQRLREGWPKMVLRQAVGGRLPDAVRWRRGKEHLGWAFTKALMDMNPQRLHSAIHEGWDVMGVSVDQYWLRTLCRLYFCDGDVAQAEKIHEAAHFSFWLDCQLGRFQKGFFGDANLHGDQQ